jgi:hypothetical protein
MNRHDVPRLHRSRRVLQTLTTVAALLLLPPFVALAIAPMLLLLAPVALIGIPFIVAALLRGLLATRSDERRRHRRHGQVGVFASERHASSTL